MPVVDLACSSVGDGVEVGPHDIGDPANFSKLPELVGGRRAFAPGVAECFDGNVDADLVTVLEAVSDGLGSRIDLHINTVNAMVLHAFAERRS
jgi:hypothetical protein